MQRSILRLSLLIGLGLAVGPAPRALADGGGPEKCELKRKVTAAERSEIERTIGRIKALLPPAPRGFKLHTDATHRDGIPAETAKDRGCPIRVEVNFAYVSLANAAAAGGKVDVQRIQKLTAEMQAAAARGDQAAMERIRQQLAGAHQAATKDVGTTVNVTLNGFRWELTEGATALTLPGAALAFTKPDPNTTTRVIIHLGKVHRSGNLVLGRPTVLANQLLQHLEVVVSGTNAVAVAKSLNLKGLNALLK